MDIFLKSTVALWLSAAVLIGGQKAEFQREWNRAYEARLYSQMLENCQHNPTIFEMEDQNESEASEESLEGQVLEPETNQATSERVQIDESDAVQAYVEVEAVQETKAFPPSTESQTELVQKVQTPHYVVNGAVLRTDIQDYLYRRLCEAGIGWFMPYAILIAYGESHFDIYAVNEKNHEDMGLFQFKSRYWGAGDIFNPFTQIDVFVGLMAPRAYAGCTVSEMISRHNTSDYGSYNQGYVDYIMSEQGNLIQIN